MGNALYLHGDCLEPEYSGRVERELHLDTKPAWLPVRS